MLSLDSGVDGLGHVAQRLGVCAVLVLGRLAVEPALHQGEVGSGSVLEPLEVHCRLHVGAIVRNVVHAWLNANELQVLYRVLDVVRHAPHPVASALVRDRVLLRPNVDIRVVHPFLVVRHDAFYRVPLREIQNRPEGHQV